MTPCPSTARGRPAGRSIPSTSTTGKPDRGSVKRFPESTKAVRRNDFLPTVSVMERKHRPSYPRWTRYRTPRINGGSRHSPYTAARRGTVPRNTPPGPA